MRYVLPCLLACTLLTGCPGSVQTFDTDELDKDAAQIDSVIAEANQCVPQNQSGGITFCTGFKLSKDDVDGLQNAGIKDLSEKIKGRGYRTFNDNRLGILSDDEWRSFVNSTKRAETFHDKKAVFFKNDTDYADYLHELLHVIQWTDKNNSPLSPLNRAALSLRMQKDLYKAVSFVEAEEKAGNITKARQTADTVQKYINRLGELENLINTLDEKDTHFFIFNYCPKCTGSDKKIAVANLFRLKNTFPPEYREKIEGEYIAYLGSTGQGRSGEAEKEAGDFFAWLKKHEKEFSLCAPRRESGYYVLCDNTRVPRDRIKELFKLSPPELVKFIEDKKIKIEIQCDNSDGGVKNTFAAFCSEDLKRSDFKKISSMHGKYVPGENTILVKSTATAGSLIHEYIHHLQYMNENKIYGKTYKRERIDIQARILREMDDIISKVRIMEAAKDKSGLPSLVKQFTQKTDFLTAFAKWQDLIDERGIFLLYIMFGHEFGASDADVDLAKKNMGFICKNKNITIPKSQCE